MSNLEYSDFSFKCVETVGPWKENALQQIDFTFNILFLIHFIIRASSMYIDFVEGRH